MQDINNNLPFTLETPSFSFSLFWMSSLFDVPNFVISFKLIAIWGTELSKVLVVEFSQTFNSEFSFIDENFTSGKIWIVADFFTSFGSGGLSKPLNWNLFCQLLSEFGLFFIINIIFI